MTEHHRMFVDGEWIEAAGSGTFTVSDPATGEVIADVADGGPARSGAGHRGGAPSLPGLVGDARPGARRRSSTGSSRSWRPTGRTSPAWSLARTGSPSTRRGARSRSPSATSAGSPRRRDGPTATRSLAGAGEAPVGPPPAAGVGRRRHALELPRDDGDAEDRPGARRRMHGGAQASLGHAPDRAPPRAALGRGGAPERRVQRGDRLALGPHRHDARRAPAGREARLHRLDRRRQGADGRGGRTAQARVARARRKRALRRLRRRRPRRGGRGRGGDEVPARRGPVVHLRQPDLRPGGDRGPLHPRFVDGVRALKVGPGPSPASWSARSSTTRPAGRSTSWSRTPCAAGARVAAGGPPSARGRSRAGTSTRRRSCSTRATRCASARRRSSGRSPPSSRSTRRAS